MSKTVVAACVLIAAFAGLAPAQAHTKTWNGSLYRNPPTSDPNKNPEFWAYHATCQDRPEGFQFAAFDVSNYRGHRFFVRVTGGPGASTVRIRVMVTDAACRSPEAFSEERTPIMGEAGTGALVFRMRSTANVMYLYLMSAPSGGGVPEPITYSVSAEEWS